MGNVDTNKLKQLLLAMIDTLDASESNEEDQEVVQTEQIVTQTKSIQQHNTKRRKPYSDGENLFLSMPEMNMHKSDVEIDKKLAPKQLTARNRQSTLVDVKCRVCGKQENVSAQLITDGVARYKCNNCSKGSG